jgi:putative ATPase
MPEGNLALAEAAVYLATAQKSNSLYTAYADVQHEVKTGKNEAVPLHLRNPVTGLMKNIGYGSGYKYAHNYAGHVVDQEHLPLSLRGKRFYYPGELGYEREISARLRAWKLMKRRNVAGEEGEGI